MLIKKENNVFQFIRKSVGIFRIVLKKNTCITYLCLKQNLKEILKLNIQIHLWS